MAAILVLVGMTISQQSFGRRFTRRLLVIVVLMMAALAGLAAAGLDLNQVSSLDRFEGISIDNPEEGENVAFRTDWWSALYDQGDGPESPFRLAWPGISPIIILLFKIKSDSQFPIRSPHNYNMTVFSRMGITGAFLWSAILFLGLFIPLWDVIKPNPH